MGIHRLIARHFYLEFVHVEEENTRRLRNSINQLLVSLVLQDHVVELKCNSLSLSQRIRTIMSVITAQIKA